MQSFGFIRVAAAMPIVHIADPKANCEEMLKLTLQAQGKAVSILAFPELSICGYSCSDLLAQSKLLKDSENACHSFVQQSAQTNVVTIFGAPLRYRGHLYNTAIVAYKGRILGIVPKTYLAANSEFSEPRWFASSSSLPDELQYISFAGQDKIPFGVRQIFSLGESIFGVEICQDLWVAVPPSTFAALNGAHILFNLSASNEAVQKQDYRHKLISSTSARFSAAYVYCSCGYGESTQDLVWAGSSLIYENGELLAESQRFSRQARLIMSDVDIDRLDEFRTKEASPVFAGEIPHYEIIDIGSSEQNYGSEDLLRKIDPYPFLPSEENLDKSCNGILSSQVLALCTRLEHIHCKKLVIGVSGGLDSSLALIVAALTFDELGIDRKNIIGVSMPGFGTSERTYNNSAVLMRLLDVESREISIVDSTRRHFEDIGHDESVHDLTYENSQARERTQILMDLAGKEGAIVLGTGDLSELALGWCTYNGDHMSMYGINAGIPKTLIPTLLLWAADNKFASEPQIKTILSDIAQTPVSPELVPVDDKGEISQKTEDIIGPYELHDFFLYNLVRRGYTPEKILFLSQKAFGQKYDKDTLKRYLNIFLKRFFSSQFKRSCLPDGPKIGSVSLSPRGDWHMSSDIEKAWKVE